MAAKRMSTAAARALLADGKPAILPPLRQVLPLGIAALCLWLLAQRLGGIDTAALAAAWAQIAPHQ